MKTAYLDCFSGVSGDMLLGALVDAGLPEDALTKTIHALKIPGCEIEITKVQENGLAAARVKIKSRDAAAHRHLADIEQLINAASLSEQVKEKALKVFHILAEAEAAVHGCGIEEVHFHEVGAVDALVDIVGVVSGFDHMGIQILHSSPLPIPKGWVSCAHGELPVPAPAALKLLKGKPVYGIELDQELVTPTGAALVHVLADTYGPMPPMHLEQIGYGAGSNKRNDGRPNLLRLITGISRHPEEMQQVEVIETALDDWNPETWPHVAEQLFKYGALDVLLIPVQMKKGRPGFLIKIICDPSHGQEVKQVLLSETSAIGLRYHTEQRMTLPRELVTVQTRFGPVQAKKITTPSGTVITPEFEDCRKIALEKDVPIKDVYNEVTGKNNGT